MLSRRMLKSTVRSFGRKANGAATVGSLALMLVLTTHRACAELAHPADDHGGTVRSRQFE